MIFFIMKNMSVQKFPFSLPGASLFIALFVGISAFAQTVSTQPVGFLKVNLPAGTTASPSRTPFSVAIQNQSSVPSGSATGTITAVGTSSISDSAGNWTPGALSAKATPYLIRILSGTARGTNWQISTSAPNTATTLTVLNQGFNLTNLGIVSGVDTYEIIPADTLNNLFGATILPGGATSSEADNVEVWNGFAWIVHYFNTTANQWQRVASPDTYSGDTVIRPDAGMIIIHRFPVQTFRLLGRMAPSGLQLRYATQGYTYLCGYPITQTFGAAKFQNLPGWKQNADYLQADVVEVWNGFAWISYFFNPSPTPGQWQRAGLGTSADTVPVFIPGRPVMFNTRGPDVGPALLLQTNPLAN